MFFLANTLSVVCPSASCTFADAVSFALAARLQAMSRSSPLSQPASLPFPSQQIVYKRESGGYGVIVPQMRD